MRNILKVSLTAVALVASLGLVAPPTVQAGSIQYGSIVGLYIYGVAGADSSYSDPYAIVFTSGGSNTKATCSTYAHVMAIRINSNKGRALLSVATSASLSGKLVHIAGRGNTSCATVAQTGWLQPVELVEHMQMMIQ